jgi:CO dehydrogenase/acetyl-CoA synthase delta subunit
MSANCGPSCCPPDAAPGCCGGQKEIAPQSWFTGWLDTPVGRIPRVATRLRWQDQLGAVKVRSSIGRMAYAVEPGLYAVGEPTGESPVLVTANYKLTFDRVRQELCGLDAWILVLDTKGVNVWCAAGKGTFGTDEVIARIIATKLKKLVTHRTLILPQLGAPGVAGHEVKKRSGFNVKYGPIYAADIKAFLAAEMKATPEMRRVHFRLVDRLAVIPVELVLWAPWVFGLALLLWFVALLAGGSGLAWRSAALVLTAYLAGGFASPILLPLLPGRAFSIKGALVGLATVGGAILLKLLPMDALSTKLELAAWVCLVPAISAFMAMNFTGTSTYTSQSGVAKEMKIAVPAQAVAGLIGLGLWAASLFI